MTGALLTLGALAAAAAIGYAIGYRRGADSRRQAVDLEEVPSLDYSSDGEA